jgi:hypothetical protein
MEIAGYSNISATANLISLPYKANNSRISWDKNEIFTHPNNSAFRTGYKAHRPSLPNNSGGIGKFMHLHYKKNPQFHKVYNLSHFELDSKANISEKKIYIATYINRYRVIGCVDSGSDLTIIHSSLYNKIRLGKTSLVTSDIPYITTFSDNNLKVEGKFPCKLRLSKFHLGINISIYVIPDIPNQTPFLLGNDLLREGLGQVSYIQSNTGPIPEITFKKPRPFECKVFYTAPRELYTCEATCSLAPNETQDVEFVLNPAAPVVRSDYILITATQLGTVSIIPSRSDLEFVNSKQAYTAYGRVINLSDQTIKTTIVGKYELII